MPLLMTITLQRQIGHAPSHVNHHAAHIQQIQLSQFALMTHIQLQLSQFSPMIHIKMQRSQFSLMIYIQIQLSQFSQTRLN